ncbi:putative uncharacterized protein [Hungatella hathewayi CAG:224]|nr:putative uncharacterized protein [Hungatella hathewayi CAG:224]
MRIGTAIKRNIKLYFPGVIIVIFSLAFPHVCHAGGLNASEQSVVAAASGTFEWEGHTYRAKQNYIDSLIAYLSGDDVDLGEADCRTAIQKMYENVGRGVSEGYLELIDGRSEQDSKESKVVPEKGNAANQSAETEYEGHAAPVQLDGQDPVETEEAVWPVYRRYSETMRETYLLLKKPVIQQEQNYGKWWSIPYTGMEIIIFAVCVFLLLSLLTAGAGNWRKHRRFQLSKRMKRFLFAVSSFCWIVIMGIPAAFLAGMQKDSAVKLLGKTHFYENIYITVQADIEEIALLADIPQLSEEDETLYGKVMIQARRQTIDALNQKNSTSDYSVLLNGVEGAVREKKGEEAASIVTACLKRRYENLLVWDGVMWWLQETGRFNGFIRSVSLPVAVILLLTNGLLILSRSRKYRGIRTCAYSLVCSALLLLLASASLWLWIRFGTLAGKPAASDEFTCLYLQNLALLGMVTGGMAGCISMGILEAARYMKRSK